MQAEVCVVGGGPAGAAVAARLAMLGHEVVLVEREPFPREHVGESLSPGVWPLLELLGVGEAPCLRPPSRVLWGGVERTRPAGEGGVTVDRGAFDALLLRHAAACGVEVCQPALATVAPSDGGWEVSLRGAAGRTALRAAFVIDATGRRRALGGGRRLTSPRMLCLHARWRGAPAEEMLVEQRPDGWLWSAPLPDGSFRAMAFVDGGRLRERGIGAAELPAHYRSLLADSRLLAAVARSGAVDGRVSACDATSFVSRQLIDARSARVGEAAFAIDPLSSSGVALAIQTALSAATAAHTILAPELDSEPAIEFYAEQVRHASARHARLAAGFYGDGPAARPFWRSRAPQAPSHRRPAQRPALADLLARPVCLARETAVVGTPCVVGDRVERRLAITHASLGRPVAFLGGHELVPLVAAATAAPTLEAAIAGWRAGGVAAPTAQAVARWLAEHGVIAGRDP